MWAMSNLFHIIYTSIGVKRFSDAELVDLLDTCLRNNKRLGITGMLLYDSQVFFQVIEGEREIILQMYEAIKADCRHRSVRAIVKEEIDAKEFFDWSMGFSKVSKEQLNQIDGLNDFFSGNRCFIDINLGIAKKLLQIFAANHGAVNSISLR